METTVYQIYFGGFVLTTIAATLIFQIDTSKIRRLKVWDHAICGTVGFCVGIGWPLFVLFLGVGFLVSKLVRFIFNLGKEKN